jgi:hypothetical protein
MALDAVRRSGTTVVVVTHDPEVGARFGRSVTIRDGRVGAEGRLGEEYAVVGRDGSIHLPTEVLRTIGAGSLIRVTLQADGTVLLTPAPLGGLGPAGGPGPAPLGGESTVGLPHTADGVHSAEYTDGAHQRMEER